MPDQPEPMVAGPVPALEADLNRGGQTLAQFLTAHGLQAVAAAEPHVTPAVTGAAAPVQTAKYELGDTVASGGMGNILAARDLNCRRTVALKVMRPEYQTDTPVALRFIEEAQISAQLEHPNIVPVHELAVDDRGQLFYTMKLVRGVNLRQVLDGIQAGKASLIARYPLFRLLEIFQRVCDAVAFAHSRHVIHRDLKPENIMLGEYGEVLVLDWGLAKIQQREKGAVKPRAAAVRHKPVSAAVSSARDEAGAAALRTLHGEVMGTPAYMSPEQARGDIENLDARADVYALGAMLYSILTLHPPVEAETVAMVLVKVSRGDIPLPTVYNRRPPAAASPETAAVPAARGRSKAELRQAAAAALRSRETNSAGTGPLPHCPGNAIPPALAAVAMKALALVPEDRYASVLSLQAEITAFLGGFATQAEDADWYTQLRLLVGRHRAATFISLATLLLLLAIGVLAGVRVNHERNAARALASQAQADEVAAVAAENAARQAATQAARLYLLQARQASDARQWDDARTAARFATDLDGTLAPAFFEMGRANLGAGALAAAADAFASAQRLTPADTRTAAYANLAREADLQTRLEHRALRTVLGETAQALETQLHDPVVAAALASAGWQQAVQFNRACETLSAACRPVVLALCRANPGLDAAAVTVAANFESAAAEPPTPVLRCENPKLTDLAPLRELPPELVGLDLRNAGIRDLTPLQELPLQRLDLYGAPLVNLQPLANLKLTRLGLHGTQVSDLSVLRDMPLTWLDLSGTPVRSVEDLRGRPLVYLNLAATGVRDLAPLTGLPLAELILSRTPVTDLGPLRGSELTRLELAGTGVTDYTPLLACPHLEMLYLPEAQPGALECLRAHPGLKVIADTPGDWERHQRAAEFWQKHVAPRPRPTPSPRPH